MKRTTLLAMLFACCLGVATQARSSQPQDDMKKDSMKSDKMAKKTTLVGCISEKDGKYLLTNSAHPSGIEITSSTDLKGHVGHKVKISGTMEKAPMMSGDMKSDSMKAGDKMAGDKMAMKHDDMPMMVVNVATLKMVSDHCSMDKMNK